MLDFGVMEAADVLITTQHLSVDKFDISNTNFHSRRSRSGFSRLLRVGSFGCDPVMQLISDIRLSESGFVNLIARLHLLEKSQIGGETSSMFQTG